MRTMSGKVKWAIGLLAVWMVLGFGQMVQNSGSASFLLVIVVLMECLPTIAVIVLTHYDHKYAAPKNGTFTLLRVWALALIWLQPVLSLLSYIAAGAFTSFILGVWVASCLFPLIAFILLFVDGKHTKINFNTPTLQTETSETVSQIPYKRLKKRFIMHQVFFFSETDIKNVYNKSLIAGKLDESLLDIEIAKFHQIVLDKEAEIKTIYGGNIPNNVMHSICSYVIEKNPNPDDLRSYTADKISIALIYPKLKRSIISVTIFVLLTAYSILHLCIFSPWENLSITNIIIALAVYAVGLLILTFTAIKILKSYCRTTLFRSILAIYIGLTILSLILVYIFLPPIGLKFM